MTKLKLTRNLRKKIKQGHPWVYKGAFDVIGSQQSKKEASWALLTDNKGDVSKGIYDPTSDLGFRALGLKSLSDKELHTTLQKAANIRLGLYSSKTNAFRLTAGEGDGLAGMVCDLYGPVAVLQFDGPSMESFWLKLPIPELLLKLDGLAIETVCLKSRSDKNKLKTLSGKKLDSETVRFRENGILFETHLGKAQKTGFFLDQRDNRQHIKGCSFNKNVWNIFSYTGGFSVYAGLGKAKKVYSVDLSKGAIEQSEVNWIINDLPPELHEGIAVDAFDFLKNEKLSADMLIVDPPSMTSSKDSVDRAKKKYVDLFASAARNVKRNGDLVLSSCSSQVSFEDFKEIASEALSESRRKGQVLRFSGQGIDHPYPHSCEELRYLKFMHLVLD